MSGLTLPFVKFAQLVNCPPGSGSCEGDTNLPQVDANALTLQNVLQILFGVVAAMTVIFIIISAIKLSTSLGNPQAVKQLRGSIIYAAIGLAVVLLAEVLVTFLLGSL